MNRFVIVLSEQYDGYDAEVPHPVLTKHTKEELVEDIKRFLHELHDYYYASPRNSTPYPRDIILDTSLTVLGTNFDCSCGLSRGAKSEINILTVEEWFEQYGNRRFNL